VIDIESVFEDAAWAGKFDDELEALRSGDKTFSFFTFPRDMLGTECIDLSQSALDAGLLVTYHLERFPISDGDYEELVMFVLHPDQIWRVPAHIALMNSSRAHRWSDGQEALHSALLGYDREETSRWLCHVNHTQAGWGCGTLYLLMSERQRASLARACMRCFPEEALAPEATVVKFQGQSKVPKSVSELPGDIVIARLGVSWSFIRTRFGGLLKRDVAVRVLTPKDAHDLNCALESKIEVWTSSGWKVD
jgi:hypothetical protein